MKTILYTLVGLAVMAAVFFIVFGGAYSFIHYINSQPNPEETSYFFIKILLWLYLIPVFLICNIVGKEIITSINKNNKQQQ